MFFEPVLNGAHELARTNLKQEYREDCVETYDEYRVNSGSGDSVVVDIRTRSERGELVQSHPEVSRIPTSKRAFDIGGALLIGLLALPIIVSVSLLILASGRPILYKHWRIGKDKKRFQCLKFRTMVRDADQRLKEILTTDCEAAREWEMNHKLRDDPRVTWFGEFLRRSSIDELPQLWNVIRGDMSLVGPRPIVEDELRRYGNRATYYQSVRPGLTGLWQVSGRNDVTYSRRVAFDTLYVRRMTLAVDLWILWRTLGVVIKKVGAY